MGKMRTLLCISLVVALSMMSLVVVTNATLPIPAPDLPNQCNSIERCCMPKPYTGKPAYNFEYETIRTVKHRRPAHLLSKSDQTRLEKAYRLMRALPDSDPRSLLNQMRIHCLYCDNALYYPGKEYPLEVHNGWFFLPWHRMFMYWHERILAELLEDDTFATPFWAWDDSTDVRPAPDVMPAMYADPSSSLYDAVRNNCSFPPFVVDLDTAGGCTSKTDDFIRIQNSRLQYSQLVLGAPTPSLFFGLPYFFGDYGGRGPGTFEDQPHGTVHLWVGRQDAASLGPQYHRLDDMGNFGRAGFDPIFYAHHANVDRLWNVWTHLPGGIRTHPTHPAFLSSQFTFYDEHANLVKMNVSQVLDTNLLGYTYESLPTPWATNGVRAGRENSIPLCNPLSKAAIRSLIARTKRHRSADVLLSVPMTFKVKRPKRQSVGTEVLQISGLHIPNITLQAHWKAYLFYPNVSILTGSACPEFDGTFNWIPHVGQAVFNPARVWRVAIGPKLRQLGKDWVSTVVFTLVQNGPFVQPITFDKAEIIYDMSPTVTI